MRPRKYSPADRLRSIYRAMSRRLGPQGWWPGRTRFEVIVGAILTQNTAWTNVARAIENLRQARALTPKALASLATAELASLVRPAGYFNTKAKRLQSFLAFLESRYGLRLSRMFARPPSLLRRELLGVPGIGPETADAILLYAGGVPSFVVDSYTRRILHRHGLIPPTASYDTIQALCMSALAPDAPLYNEYHALLVAVGKGYCRTVPRCAGCPLLPDLRRACPDRARRFLQASA